MDGSQIANVNIGAGAHHGRDHAQLYHDLIGEDGWRRLHPVVRRRFSRDAKIAGPVIYAGTLSIERSWIGWLFAQCARVFGTPLPVSAVGEAPAEVRVYSDGGDGVVWERRLSPKPGRLEIVRSTKRPWTEQRLLECARRGLSMLLAVFEQNGSLVFESRGFGLLLGGSWLRIPAMFTPGICRVTHTALNARRFRFTLEIDHPRWGRLMTQSGIFIDPEA